MVSQLSKGSTPLSSVRPASTIGNATAMLPESIWNCSVTQDDYIRELNPS